MSYTGDEISERERPEKEGRSKREKERRRGQICAPVVWPSSFFSLSLSLARVYTYIHTEYSFYEIESVRI